MDAFADLADEIDSRRNSGVKSDQVLARLRPALETQGFIVEASKAQADKILRPVLFGENGETRVAYEVDAFHPDHGVVIEIEAGRGAANNADYRDIMRASLMVDARYLVLAMMLAYGGGGTVTRSYERTRNRIDAIYASDRLQLPLDGLLLATEPGRGCAVLSRGPYGPSRACDLCVTLWTRCAQQRSSRR
ncbi:MAG: hypothetical protein ACRDPC_09625 [Solirubrobacteraceae bacterium]